MALPFPNIDPVIIQLGPIALRWYSLAYLVGIIGGIALAKRLQKRWPSLLPRELIDDAFTFVLLGIVVGGRLGYVIFYQPLYYLFQPWEILFVWQGGMSFHGGVLGLFLGCAYAARKHRVPVLAVSDMASVVATLGLCLGRLANFINGELWGRPTDVPWAMVFPEAVPAVARHPSQLYEAFLEGVVLFLILWLLVRRGYFLRPGLISGVFAFSYAFFRVLVEFFRQPDQHIGLLALGFSLGQYLSFVMAIVGIWGISQALRRPPMPDIRTIKPES